MRTKFFSVIGLIICISAALCGCTSDVAPLVGTWVRTDIDIVYTLNADMTYTKDDETARDPHISGTFEYNGKTITLNPDRDATYSYELHLYGDTMYWGGDADSDWKITLKRQ